MTAKEKEKISDFKKCNFKEMCEYFKKISEERKNRSKEEKNVSFLSRNSFFLQESETVDHFAL